MRGEGDGVDGDGAGAMEERRSNGGEESERRDANEVPPDSMLPVLTAFAVAAAAATISGAVEAPPIEGFSSFTTKNHFLVP